MARATKRKRAQAAIDWENSGAPDPFAWLVERWAAKAGDARLSPGSNSKRAQEAEELGLKLLPYIRPRLKHQELDVGGVEEVTVIIGGNGSG